MSMRAQMAQLGLMALCMFAWVMPAVAAAYRHERSVVPAGPGPNWLAVDVALMTGAQPLRYSGVQVTGGLEDVRFFDPQGQEVGYLVVSPAVPEAARWQAGSILAVAPTEKTSGFEVDLGAPIVTDRLRIEGVTAPFLKRARLEGSGDRAHWVVLADDATVFDLPDEGLQRKELTFPASELRYLRVTWDDRNSAVVAPPRQVSARVPTAPAPPEVVRVPIAFERRTSEPGVSRFRLRLPGPHLPISSLDLRVGGGHLLREARVSEARLQGHEAVQVALGSERLRRAVRGDLTAADLRIPIDQPRETELELVVVDGDNPPIELLAVDAELGPIPWIYFESRDGASLTARYGDPKLSAPRYDLEALRGSVARASAQSARWGDVRELAPPVEEPQPADGGLPAIGAQIDTAELTYRRTIAGGPLGLTALVLDAAVLAHGNELRDVRIVDGNGRQVPYLVERLGEPLSLDLTWSALPSRETRISRYSVVLPYDSLPASRLVLSTGARVFDRSVSVYVERVSSDARDKVRLERVATERWRQVDTEERAHDLVVNLPRLGTAQLEIRVDDGDNSPLPLAAPRLLLPSHRLRFYRVDEGPLALLYGQPKLTAPTYDLVLLAPRVFGGRAYEVAATAETAAIVTPTTASKNKPNIAFWAALSLAVVVLLVLIARLVGRGEERSDVST